MSLTAMVYNCNNYYFVAEGGYYGEKGERS